MLSALVVLSSVTFAQLGLNAIGVGAGFVSVSNDVGSGLLLGAGADLGELSKGLHLRPDVGYWSVSKTAGGVEVKSSDFSINANVIYQIPSGGQMSPFYLGGGLGLNMVTAEAAVTFLGTSIKSSASNSRIGINLLAGAGVPIGPKMMLHGEARYVLVSDFNHFGIMAGIAFLLK